jgi:NAD(P)-dependent dehydrogenase (short-subunit alcohol dehydrogenase family)
MNGSFDGQVVMITGAAQGLGLAMAEAFLEEGAVVVGTDVNDTGLRAAARHRRVWRFIEWM